MLDYGCGSGMLAIAASRFGAADVDAVDIDPAAVEATEANARANGVALHAGLPDSVAGPYALVLANILATPLKLLAPLLCGAGRRRRRAGAGGHPRAPGRRADAAYAPWIELAVADDDDGWILMVGRRRGAERMA